jgi:hypothetical protein
MQEIIFEAALLTPDYSYNGLQKHNQSRDVSLRSAGQEIPLTSLMIPG